MDFHFRSQQPNTKSYNYKPGGQKDFISFTKDYLSIRLRQIIILSSLIIAQSGVLTAELKNLLVRNMYWGRTSFYKTAFHILVIIITLSALYTGLGTRIVSGQRDSLQNISVNSRTFIDSDLVAQQGSLTPLEEISDDTDTVYSDYVVVPGDSLQKIASKFKLNVDTLRWANNIPVDRDTLKVGQTIKVPKMNGVLHVVGQGDTVDSILAKVKLSGQSDKSTFLELNAQHIDTKGRPIAGRTVFIPDATIPRPVAIRPSYTGGSSYQPLPTPPSSVPAGTFTNPMQYCSYSFNRGYSYGHTGVDLGTASGCWIAAVASGTVTRARWCGDLGYCVVIKHSGGYSTVYGHGNGVLAVRAGQTVVAGQRIMQSGRSGRASGPHLHISLASGGNDVFSCYRCRINPRGIIPY